MPSSQQHLWHMIVVLMMHGRVVRTSISIWAAVIMYDQMKCELNLANIQATSRSTIDGSSFRAMQSYMQLIASLLAHLLISCKLIHWLKFTNLQFTPFQHLRCHLWSNYGQKKWDRLPGPAMPLGTDGPIVCSFSRSIGRTTARFCKASLAWHSSCLRWCCRARGQKKCLISLETFQGRLHKFKFYMQNGRRFLHWKFNSWIPNKRSESIRLTFTGLTPTNLFFPLGLKKCGVRMHDFEIGNSRNL